MAECENFTHGLKPSWVGNSQSKDVNAFQLLPPFSLTALLAPILVDIKMNTLLPLYKNRTQFSGIQDSQLKLLESEFVQYVLRCLRCLQFIRQIAQS